VWPLQAQLNPFIQLATQVALALFRSFPSPQNATTILSACLLGRTWGFFLKKLGFIPQPSGGLVGAHRTPAGWLSSKSTSQLTYGQFPNYVRGMKDDALGFWPHRNRNLVHFGGVI
jgi:hypothetical protein